MGGATLELFSTDCMELSALWFLDSFLDLGLSGPGASLSQVPAGKNELISPYASCSPLDRQLISGSVGSTPEERRRRCRSSRDFQMLRKGSEFF